MVISAEMVKKLREETGAGVMDCKRALQEADGDTGKARELLRQWGAASAAKKAGRETKQGTIVSYIHQNSGVGRVGVLVEINCETDFVARTDQFQQLAQQIAQHIVAAGPEYVREEDVPTDIDMAERQQILRERVLLNQRFQGDQQTIADLLKEAIGALGENIQVSRFCRFALGGD
ncbi:MAG: translation elongation factor Ts [Chloroflexi bacterium]|nr:translation elongation factor Ts [Chloroflexota bacterium]MCL5947041.1 translation elongation factor Ts [Chloroflexota bacterium]